MQIFPSINLFHEVLWMSLSDNRRWFLSRWLFVCLFVCQMGVHLFFYFQGWNLSTVCLIYRLISWSWSRLITYFPFESISLFPHETYASAAAEDDDDDDDPKSFRLSQNKRRTKGHLPKDRWPKIVWPNEGSFFCCYSIQN